MFEVREGVNAIDEIKVWAEGVWEVDSLYSLGQYIYVLKSAGDFDHANFWEDYQKKMEGHIHAEFSDYCAVEDDGWQHGYIPMSEIASIEPTKTHPIAYPECVAEGCELHPWIM